MLFFRSTFVILGVLFSLTGHALRQEFGGVPTPEQLGYHPAELPETALVSLIQNRIIRGLQARNPYLFMPFISEEYQEIPAAPENMTGFVYTDSKRRVFLKRTLLGKADLIKALEPLQASGGDPLEFRICEWLPQGDEVDCTLEVFSSAGKPRARIRLYFIREASGWRLSMSDGLSLLGRLLVSNPAIEKVGENSISLIKGEAAPAGERTFQPRPLAPDLGIDRLTRETTVHHLDRKLFSTPFSSATMAELVRLSAPPYYKMRYIQFVTDPGWNRIVYGNYSKWIKAFNGGENGKKLNRPHGMVIGPRGFLYVADTGNRRILVMKLSEAHDQSSLLVLASLGEGLLSQPYDLAYDHQGTLSDVTDDVLWVLDRGSNELLAFRASVVNPDLIGKFRRPQWEAPLSISMDRFQGVSNGGLLLLDAQTKTISRLHLSGGELQTLQEISLPPETMPVALETDYWGQVYVVDRAQPAIIKLSPHLEILARYAPQEDSFRPVTFQPLFSRWLDDRGNLLGYAGYNQAFLLEDWTSQSGGRRLELGIDFHLKSIQLRTDLSAVHITGLLTDVGELTFELIDALENKSLGKIAQDWFMSGGIRFNWQRKLMDGRMVPSGHYRLQISARSSYNKMVTTRESEPFYLPFYYYQDCGNPSVPDVYLQQGDLWPSASPRPERTIVTHPEAVLYYFPEIRPDKQYEVQMTYYADQGTVDQVLSANDVPLHAPMKVGQYTLRTAWLAIPPEAVKSGGLELRIQKVGGTGLASVAELRIREANYDPGQPPELAIPVSGLPETFVLRQNYPNPFNPTTTIEFIVPENYQGPVSLQIYNTVGQVVRTLVQRQLGPGLYRKLWDGTDAGGNRLPSGMYIYRLQAGGLTLSRKLLLMK